MAEETHSLSASVNAQAELLQQGERELCTRSGCNLLLLAQNEDFSTCKSCLYVVALILQGATLHPHAFISSYQW